MTTAPFARRGARRDRDGADDVVRSPREFVISTIISAISTIIWIAALIALSVELFTH
jgi:hypothetical protein